MIEARFSSVFCLRWLNFGTHRYLYKFEFEQYVFVRPLDNSQFGNITINNQTFTKELLWTENNCGSIYKVIVMSTLNRWIWKCQKEKRNAFILPSNLFGYVSFKGNERHVQFDFIQNTPFDFNNKKWSSRHCVYLFILFLHTFLITYHFHIGMLSLYRVILNQYLYFFGLLS